MRIVVVSEFYPRASDPVLGIWAHRQALAARDAGAEVHVLVLYRPLPPRATLARGGSDFARELAALMRQPRHQTRDGLPVTYVPFLSPPRGGSYTYWGAWAAVPLALALRRLRRSFPFELVHCHNAVPAGDAVRRARLSVPMIISVHGGDVYFTAPKLRGGGPVVRRTLGAARLVLANSAGIEQLAQDHGAARTRVVHLGGAASRTAGAPPPGRAARGGGEDASPTLITVGHLVGRKRHADVIRALALLPETLSQTRYVIVGDGPERGALADLAAELGLSERVRLLGQLAPGRALEQLAKAGLFVMPSVEEAFGVAYVEAMSQGLPAVGCRGEPGPEEIAGAGEGMRLVAPRDPRALAAALAGLLGNPAALRRLGAQAEATVARAFTWERCGEETVAAYRDALDPSLPGR